MTGERSKIEEFVISLSRLEKKHTIAVYIVASIVFAIIFELILYFTKKYGIFASLKAQDITGGVIAAGLLGFIGCITSWYFFLTIHIKADLFHQARDLEDIRPHIKMLREFETPKRIRLGAVNELRNLLFPQPCHKSGPVCTLNAVDTAGPQAWVSNGVLQYEGILSAWAKRQIIASSIELVIDYCARNDLKQFHVQFLNHRYSCRLSDTQESYPIHGRIERIFVWPLREIVSSLGSTILAFHEERAHPAYVLPQEWLATEVIDFVIWDVNLPQLLPAPDPRDKDIPRADCYGYKKLETVATKTDPEPEYDWNYVSKTERIELEKQWLELRKESVPVSHIDTIDIQARTLADKIRAFKFQEYRRELV